MRRVCSGFAQLGARGVSMIFASGDNGVGKQNKCYSNTGAKGPAFLPSFPASCPWVLSVGATEDFKPERAVSAKGPGGFASGAGFSNVFDAPTYQKKDVKAYVAGLKGKHDGLYNKKGRGFPDVSAQGYVLFSSNDACR